MDGWLFTDSRTLISNAKNVKAQNKYVKIILQNCMGFETFRWLKTISLNFSIDVPLVGLLKDADSFRGSNSTPRS